MASYVQASRPMAVTTPLGQDVLLLVGFQAHEAISQLFSFQLDLIAENNQKVPFEKLLGQQISVTLLLPGDRERYFHGICNRIAQGERDSTFTSYRMEVVPRFWLLTKKAQSRIFQHIPVPDILKKVLEGLDVLYEIQGTFHPRDYCVQYRETDFNFASRLMEEEGIYYFFKHTANGHKMVVANTPQSHPDLPLESTLIYEELEGGNREEGRIYFWEKSQELTSGHCTLWDQCFELPHKHLDAEKTILDGVAAGEITHKLKVGGNEKLEIYDYPGAYAQRFDGIDRGGGEQPAELQKIFEDNQRTVGLRMQDVETQSMAIKATSSCRQIVTGHRFTLERHFNADGQYLVTQADHVARLSGDYRSGQFDEFTYQNNFTCIPYALAFRPPLTTPRPSVQGTQTAVVVGPAGEEIFTDKYSRVKVQFHWDREGKNDADSSCWVRVGTPWAGRQWGMIHIPRIGQEVIVDFLEGDPDRPIIVGSVYNAEQMPPYLLPANKTQSGIKTRSSLGGSPANFNEIRFEDKKGSEQLYIHAEKNQDIEVENDETTWVGHDRTEKVDHDEDITIGNDRSLEVIRDKSETVGRNKMIHVANNHSEKIDSSMSIVVGSTLTEMVGVNYAETVGGAMELTVGAALAITVGAVMAETVGLEKTEAIGGSKSENIGGGKTLLVGKSLTETIKDSRTVKIMKDLTENVDGKHREEVKKEYMLQAKKIQITAEDQINLKTGKAEIIMKKNGDITIQGKKITIKGSGDVIVKGSKITEN